MIGLFESAMIQTPTSPQEISVEYQLVIDFDQGSLTAHNRIATRSPRKVACPLRMQDKGTYLSRPVDISAWQNLKPAKNNTYGLFERRNDSLFL